MRKSITLKCERKCSYRGIHLCGTEVAVCLPFDEIEMDAMAGRQRGGFGHVVAGTHSNDAACRHHQNRRESPRTLTSTGLPSLQVMLAVLQGSFSPLVDEAGVAHASSIQRRLGHPRTEPEKQPGNSKSTTGVGHSAQKGLYVVTQPLSSPACYLLQP